MSKTAFEQFRAWYDVRLGEGKTEKQIAALLSVSVVRMRGWFEGRQPTLEAKHSIEGVVGIPIAHWPKVVQNKKANHGNSKA